MGKGGGGGGRSKGREQGGGAAVAEKSTSSNTELTATQDQSLIEQKIENQWQKEINLIDKAKKEENSYSGVDKQKLEDFKFVFNEAVASDDRKFAILDKSGNPQALTTWSKSGDAVKIGYLVTAPWNLKGGDSRGVRGAGTRAIVQAVKISEKLGLGGKIKLESSESAAKFYEKLGFTGKNGAYTLSSKAARELLKKYE